MRPGSMAQVMVVCGSREELMKSLILYILFCASLVVVDGCFGAVLRA